MNDKITNIYQDIKTIENIKKNILENYHLVICDKDIPINERWNFFVTFPREYKNDQNSNFIPDSIKNNFIDFDWYKDLGYLPNVTINSACFVQLLEHMLNQDKEKMIGYMNNDFYNFYRKNPEAIDNLKEDFLQHNLLSFVNKVENI